MAIIQRARVRTVASQKDHQTLQGAGRAGKGVRKFTESRYTWALQERRGRMRQSRKRQSNQPQAGAQRDSGYYLMSARQSQSIGERKPSTCSSKGTTGRNHCRGPSTTRRQRFMWWMRRRSTQQQSYPADTSS